MAWVQILPLAPVSFVTLSWLLHLLVFCQTGRIVMKYDVSCWQTEIRAWCKNYWPRFIVMTAFSGKVNLLSRAGTYTARETRWSVWKLVRDALRECHCLTVTCVHWSWLSTSLGTTRQPHLPPQNPSFSTQSSEHCPALPVPQISKF